ncbi:hypothetical protein D3C75_1388290 [compost metagenome]
MYGRRVQFNQGAQLIVHLKAKGLDDKALMDLLEKFLDAMTSSLKSKGELQNVSK